MTGLHIGRTEGRGVAKRLLDGAAGKAFLGAALRNRELATLAELWVAGAESMAPRCLQS